MLRWTPWCGVRALPDAHITPVARQLKMRCSCVSDAAGEENVAQQALSDAKLHAETKPPTRRQPVSRPWEAAASALQKRLEEAVANRSTDLHTLVALSAAAASLLRVATHASCMGERPC